MNTPWLSFEYAVKLDQCGVDIRALNVVSRDILAMFLNGQVRVAEFLRVFPIPGGDEPAASAVCIVNSFTAVL